MSLRKSMLWVLVPAIVIVLSGMAFADLNNALVAYYPFNGNANDESGNGNDGTVHGATLVSDRFNDPDGAYSFDGVDDYIDISTIIANVSNQGVGTISLWFKANPSETSGRFLWGGAEGGIDFNFGETSSQIPDTSIRFGTLCAAAGPQVGSTFYADDVWHHAVVVMGQNYNALYVDQAKLSVNYEAGGPSSGDCMWQTPSQVWLGNDASGTALFGSLDDVRIYNRALSETEIQELFYVGTNTPVGNNVVVLPEGCPGGVVGGAPVTVTFDIVTQSGNTTLCTSPQGPPPPSGFKLGNPPVYYEINTTATYSGSTEVCIDYGGISYGNEDSLKLRHKKEGEPWQDVTSSLDTDNDIICGLVDSFSVFAILTPATSGGGGAVGGAAEMPNKIELLAPWIALGTLILLSIGVVTSRRFGKKPKN